MAKNTKIYPLLPLRGILVFPNMVLHLDVGRERSVNALEQAMVEDNKVLLVAQKEARVDEPGPDEIYTMGTIAQIKQMLKLPGGTIRVLVEGLSRATVEEFLEEDPYFKVAALEVEEDDSKTVEVEALMRSVIYQFEQYIKLSKKIPPETLVTVSGIEEPGRMADIIASHLTLKIQQKQEILEAILPKKRLEKLSEILSHEMEILEIERKINLRVRKQM
ncbi:MAG: LON peptidase substrate-binding domain-containing protein, partial [Bacillota bacterium]|nr:LON peptidase substrate-binding domain-containing protein [Bacillota bacterium]